MRRRTARERGSSLRHHVVLGLVVSLGVAGACGDSPPPVSEDQEDLSCGAITCGSLEPALVSLPLLVDETAIATTTWLDALEERCRAVVDGLGGTIEGGPVDEPLLARVERACIAARVALVAADPELVIGGAEADVAGLASLDAFEDCLALCSCDECPFTEPTCSSPNPDAGTCGSRCVGWCSSREAPVACEGRCDGRCTGRCEPDPGTAPPGEGVEVDDAPCAETCSGTCDGACRYESFHDLACEGTCVGACVGGAMQDPLCRGLMVDDLARCGCHWTCSGLVHAMGPGVGPWAHETSGAISDELARTIVDLAQVCARGGDLESTLTAHRFVADEMEGVGAQAARTCAAELHATIATTTDAITAARAACTFTLREAPRSW